MDNGRESWREVRRLRSKPPGLARDDEERRQVFQAALAQSEELWDAAAITGSASRPLPLFYCLSQAARAVCAAWSDRDEWRPEAHGLKSTVSDAADPVERTFGYSAKVNLPVKGSFNMIVDATLSPTFTGKTSVAELWSSLPDFPAAKHVVGDGPRCLVLQGTRSPNDTRPLHVQVVAPTHAVIRMGRQELTDRQLPLAYPALAGIKQDGVQPGGLLGTADPVYRFPRADGTLRTLLEVGTPYPATALGLDRVVVRPKIGSSTSGPPSEFLTLYALLFCLSELARYQPGTWVGVLDADRSPAAVTLEHGLDLALANAPRFIRNALRGPLDVLMREQMRELGN